MSPEDAAQLQQIQDRLDALRLADEYSGIRYHDAEIARLSWVVETISGYDATVRVLEDFVARACKILEGYTGTDPIRAYSMTEEATELIETCEDLGLYEQEGL